MRHATAVTLITDPGSGALAPDLQRQLDRHLVRCAECRAWLRTYRLLDEALTDEGKSGRSEHLSSQELAAFSLAPETLDEPSRERCERHLGDCGRCRYEAALAREAVAAARGSRIRGLTAQTASVRRLAAAAGLLLAVGALVYLALARTPKEQNVFGGRLEGIQTLAARRSIVIGTTEVDSGASVTLRSGELVALGNGFSVESGAHLRVEVDRGTTPRGESTNRTRPQDRRDGQKKGV